EEQIINDALEALGVRWVALLRGLVIAAMVLFSVSVLTSSPWKASVLSFLILLISQITSMRKFVQLPILAVFMCTAIYWCDPQIIDRLKGTWQVASFSR
ncbi:MAG: hypothetical protein JWO28_2644, partial [Hyphomicrobiales bacterium]|nr:hypothetical protein [Hyphomicrobiales bacterium]